MTNYVNVGNNTWCPSTNLDPYSGHCIISLTQPPSSNYHTEVQQPTPTQAQQNVDHLLAPAISTFMIVVLVIYFIPTIIASLRRHRNRFAIFMLNLFFGWTLIGWVGSLIWACLAQNPPPVTMEQMMAYNDRYLQRNTERT